MHIVECICDDDAATLLGGLACAVGCLDPGTLGPESWRCRRWRRTSCSFLLHGIDGVGVTILEADVLFAFATLEEPGRDLLLVQPTLEKMPRGDVLFRAGPVCRVCMYARLCTRTADGQLRFVVCAPSYK